MAIDDELELQDSYFRFRTNFREAIDCSLREYGEKNGISNKNEIFDNLFPEKPNIVRKVNDFVIRGSILDHEAFSLIFDRLIFKYFSDEELKESIDDDYNKYYIFAKSFLFHTLNFKTVLASKADINHQFNLLIIEKNENIRAIFSNYDIYIDFVHYFTERLAAQDDYPAAIKNSWIISNYIMKNRKTDTFRSVGDEEISIMLAEVARLGAWAAWSVGDAVSFDRLCNLIDTAGKISETKVFHVLSNIMIGHSHAMRGDAPDLMAGGYNNALYAHENIKNEKFAPHRDDRSVLNYNVALTTVEMGGTLSTLIPQIENRTIKSIIDEYYDVNIFYKKTSLFRKLIIEFYALINSGELEEAENKMRDMAMFLVDEEYRDQTLSKASFLKCQGKLFSVKTGEIENEYYKRSREIYRRLGHFSKAREIEVLLGWRKH